MIKEHVKNQNATRNVYKKLDKLKTGQRSRPGKVKRNNATSYTKQRTNNQTDEKLFDRNTYHYFIYFQGNVQICIN